MKSQIMVFMPLVFALVVIGCTSNSTSPSAVPPTEAPIATEAPTVEDKASLMAALQAAGTTVEPGEPVSQAFFTPEGSLIRVNEADVQVFEYKSAEEMENEASQVSSDGGSIGTSMVTWIDTPHFYKAGRIIVLYVGDDIAVLGSLERALSPQFAGG